MRASVLTIKSRVRTLLLVPVPPLLLCDFHKNEAPPKAQVAGRRQRRPVIIDTAVNSSNSAVAGTGSTDFASPQLVGVGHAAEENHVLKD